MKKRGLFIFMLCVFLAAGAAVAAEPIPLEKINPSYIYIGPVGDGGWTYMQDAGREKTDKDFPGLKSTIVESVPEGPAVVPVLEKLVRQGKSKLIFACSFGYMDFVMDVAKKYPDVTFMHVSGYKRADNVGTLFGRMYQPRYLSGLVAGSMSKSGNIGYVAAHPIPEVIRMINAFTLGVRKVNPKATVKVIWLFSWFDPGKEKEAAKALIDAGCDVLGMHADTGAVAQACEEAKVYVVGYNNDMSKYAPTMHITAPIWNWEKMFAPIVQQVADGTWKSEAIWAGMKEGAVELAPFGPAVPEDVRKQVMDDQEKIVKGEWDVFTGPIKDQKGEVRVKEGESMSDSDIWSMNWFVEGVSGEIPR
ncbi:BMP family ABC transporter substrate-binding protein [Fretibacterium sp. OH1220_COT-178]|uniref:BMP family ABC transporter substrate-binding protein n=1 Tax=Fretibacterium sp. OH1220_COT-178 TaxID=2491047 RepID=UPI000F5F36F8|nr:BMP family ABC transporter substrate-binding protein [Fretibacterium sp. OH1220_COT-178]RRD65610.1 BMP family ABC transporter substrate-binding protein [Fretibacterium sp. OH1220_COT-178]